MSSPTLFGFTDHDMKNSIDEQDKKRVKRDPGEDKKSTQTGNKTWVHPTQDIQIQSSHSLLRQEVKKSFSFNYTSWLLSTFLFFSL